MSKYYIAPTNTNSIFAVTRNPDMRFSLREKLANRVIGQTEKIALDNCKKVGLSLYDVISDALRFTQIWSSLGMSEREILRCRQSIHDFSNNASLKKLELLKNIQSFVLLLNINLAIINMMVNDVSQGDILLYLFTPRFLQGKFETTLMDCQERPRIQGKFGWIELPGLTTKNVLQNSINVLTFEDIKEIAEFLRRRENEQLITNIYITAVASLQDKNLKCINSKELFKAFTGDSQLADFILSSMYLHHNSIAFLMKD